MKSKKFILFIVYFVLCGFFFSQNKTLNYKEERHKFNRKLISNQSYEIITKRITSSDEFRGSFLGSAKTRLGKSYFVVKSSYIFNLNRSPTAENHIFIYNSKKEFVGYYYLSNINQLPQKLHNNKLYFNNEDCKEKIIINLTNGIPAAINLKCNGEDDFVEFK
ncbi:hypothetical protein [Chryseobacterium sp.]|uniref:hypothetical protein n=1 Tax=Chryseobacterium sp. TaxID=1871047 RepID=UPI002898D2CF|nr:hypothetical protein [Chryseobacterium sp.]